MAHDVAVLAFGGISPFHLSVPTLVLTTPGAAEHYRVAVCAAEPGPLPTRGGFDIAVHHGLEVLASADTVILASWDPELPVPPEVVDAVRAAHARGARLVALCLGAFVLAATGLVDGREVTTHWHGAAELARRYPRTRVRDDVLWTDLGDVVSSAGTVAALDCCLHMVRTDLGAAVAGEVARRLVMAPHRDGSQAQFVRVPIPDDEHDDIAEAMVWARARLAEPLDLDTWADGVLVSRRTFTRRFRERTGESPGRWLLRRRLELARTLLETTRLPMDEVARRSGLGSSASMRRHFREVLHTSPRHHRETFALRTCE